MDHTLELTRPLAVIDLETTGISVQSDRIIEVAILKLMPDGQRTQFEHRVNPGVPIPEASTEIHGITDADVALEPIFEHLAPGLLEFLEGCDIAGFNVRRFDIPLLRNELERCGLTIDLTERHVIDMQTIYHSHEPRDLTAALSFYCGRDHVGAHGAMADVLATADIFSAQLQRYHNLPSTIEELEAVIHPKDPDWLDDEGKLVWKGNNVIIAFGKHRGTSLRQLARVDRNYLEWIMNGNFTPSVKTVIKDALEGIFPAARQG